MLLVDIISDLISAISTDKRWFELVSTIILQSLTIQKQPPEVFCKKRCF